MTNQKYNKFTFIIFLFFLFLTARRFDFFDTGIMEGLQYRLKFTEKTARGIGSMVQFKGRVCMKRTTTKGQEYLIKWEPSNM